MKQEIKCGVYTETSKQRIFRKIRWFFSYDMLYTLLSEKWGGNDNPPLDHKSKTFESDGLKEVIAFVEDGGEVGLGYPESWHHTYRRKTFNKMVCWYLLQVIIFDWCGLRTFIWFKLLKRQCKKYKLNN